MSTPHFSLIVCTYRRAGDLARLLQCILHQTYRDFEVLIVDGSGAEPAVRDQVAAFRAQHHEAVALRLLETPAGLTRQRNAGLRHAAGALICFLDDDVSFAPDFLARAAAILAEPGMAGTGGITGYDLSYYPQPVTPLWRLKRALGIVPSLAAGAIDHLGRRTPIEFARPVPARQPVGWLPGFCMIFRREAIGDCRFDEALPTYAGEDKEFSAAVGAHRPLVLCADLTLTHHRSPAERQAEARRIYQIGFGMGRGFAQRARTPRDYLTGMRYTLGEVAVQALRFAHRPSRDRLAGIGALPRGVLAGYRSGARRP